MSGHEDLDPARNRLAQKRCSTIENLEKANERIQTLHTQTEASRNSDREDQPHCRRASFAEEAARSYAVRSTLPACPEDAVEQPPAAATGWDTVRRKRTLLQFLSKPSWIAPAVVAPLDDATDTSGSGLRMSKLSDSLRWSRGRLSMSSSRGSGFLLPDTDDINLVSTRHWFIMHPLSAWRVYWDHALVAMALATVLVVPIRLAFVFDAERSALPGLIYTDVVLDACCVLDVASNFFFAFIVHNMTTKKPELVADWRLIARRYARRRFLVELLSVGIPFSVAAARPLLHQWLSLIKLLRVQRLLRVRARDRNRAHDAGRMPRPIVISKMINISRLLAGFYLWSHVCACVFWFIGRIEIAASSGDESAAGVSWIAAEAAEGLTADGDELLFASEFTQYIVALYWSTTTALTIGYGDITPHTSAERIFVILVMMSSSVLYATIFGQVTTLVDSLDQVQNRYQRQMQRFSEFASIYKLPVALRARIYSHVHYKWQLTRGLEVESVLDALPSGVRRDIQLFLLANIVQSFPIFQNVPQNFIAAVVEKFRAELIAAQEFVFSADEPGRHLYIIHTGRVEVITPEGVVVGSLSDGSYFGEIAILVDVRRTSSVRTTCRSHFYKLSKEDFDEVLEGYPELRDKMVSKALARLRKITKLRANSLASDTCVCSAANSARSTSVISASENGGHQVGRAMRAPSACGGGDETNSSGELNGGGAPHFHRRTTLSKLGPSLPEGAASEEEKPTHAPGCRSIKIGDPGGDIGRRSSTEWEAELLKDAEDPAHSTQPIEQQLFALMRNLDTKMNRMDSKLSRVDERTRSRMS